MESILLTVNLNGCISGPKAHVDLQINRVDVSRIGSKHAEWITNRICHTDRTPEPCVRKMTIDSSIVSDWVSNTCPPWEKIGAWEAKNDKQRIESHLSRYDEGYGYEYSFFAE